nr:Late embryogenesis abundant protein, LEA-14 [Ipomoea batatas]
MTSSTKSDSQSPSSPTQFVLYQSLPSESQQPQYIIVLPPYPRPHPIFDRSCRNFLLCVSIIILLAVTVLFLWPSGLDVSVARLKLKGFKVHLIPLLTPPNSNATPPSVPASNAAAMVELPLVSGFPCFSGVAWRQLERLSLADLVAANEATGKIGQKNSGCFPGNPSGQLRGQI